MSARVSFGVLWGEPALRINGVWFDLRDIPTFEPGVRRRIRRAIRRLFGAYWVGVTL